MWPFFNFQKNFEDLAWAVKRNEEGEKMKLIKRLIRNRRTSVKKLVKTLQSSIFNADIWFTESHFACDLLILLAQDKHTRPLVIKALNDAARDSSSYYNVKPTFVLDQIGA